MINQVRNRINDITMNATKRKNEEKKLNQEKDQIDEKKVEIERLKTKLDNKKRKLNEKKHELKMHEKFNLFLEQVVNEKDGQNKEFENIEALQNRFKNLKNENKKLLLRVNNLIDSYFEFMLFRNNKLIKIWKKPGNNRSKNKADNKLFCLK